MVQKISTSTEQFDIYSTGETWELEVGEKITSTAHGINEKNTTGGNTILVNGSVVASWGDGQCGVLTQGANSKIVIGEKGSVNGNYGVETMAAGDSIENRGAILTNFRGVFVQNVNSTFINSGTIKSADGALDVQGVYAHGGTVFTNAAAGAIDVTGVAVTISSATGETTTITNLGSIAGNTGSFESWNGVEKLINHGKMEGDVKLGNGADIYDGVGGTLTGSVYGGGDGDTYIVSSTATRIVELANQGTDTVKASVSYTLGANVENLVLSGANLDGKGNGLANTILGTAGDNKLFGYANADTLKGAAGKDTLDGGAGADKLYGGAGDDKYYLDNRGDKIFEDAKGGNDIAYSKASHVLEVNVENLKLQGVAKIDATGNGGKNTLTGNDGDNVLKGLGNIDKLMGGKGADTLIGGAGKDTLTGGAGKDVFVFKAGFGTDTITDFHSGDKIDLHSFKSIKSFGDLMNQHISTVKGDAHIDFGHDTLIVHDVTKKELHSGDFIL